MSDQYLHNVTELVRISIRFPDNKDLSEFLRWQMDNKVFGVHNTGGLSGRGRYMGYFTYSEATLIKAYLKDKKSKFTPLI